MTHKPLSRGIVGAWKAIFDTAPNVGMKFTQQQYAELQEMCRGYLSYLDMVPRPIEEAPRDGTQILAWETPNGESHNLVMARFHTLYTHEIDEPPKQDPKWWASGFRIGWNDWNGKGLYGRAENIAISPYAFIPLSSLPIPKGETL